MTSVTFFTRTLVCVCGCLLIRQVRVSCILQGESSICLDPRRSRGGSGILTTNCRSVSPPLPPLYACHCGGSGGGDVLIGSFRLRLAVRKRQEDGGLVVPLCPGVG